LSRDLVEHFRNLMVARLTEKNSGYNNAELLDVPDQEIAELKGQAKDLSLETLIDYCVFMSAGEEEIARSANPRFALEAVMVRLAILPKTLPVSELVERLERLEQKLAGRSMSVEPATKTAPPPSASTQPINSGRAPEPALVSGNKEQIWRDFVSLVRKEKKFLASHLDQAKLLELTPGHLFIGVGERHELSYLLDSENLAALKNIAKSFFSVDTAIEVTLVADRHTTGQQAGDGAFAGAERSEIVNEAVRILGGTVRSVRRDAGER
jgi:DNA polymerase-3 subunit gamma/tau